MSYNKINNILGWAVCIMACTVYMMTKEATVSFWDCGEFTAGAAKLEVVHSPGAPLFLMLGRLFVIIFGGMDHAAQAINTLSALSSGFTILFLFWTITHFAKRIILGNGEEATGANLIKIMGAGVVGALAYTFSDTFWFSAVEGEVYALSSFLTALVFWAILKWEDRVSTDNEYMADRWIVLIAFIMGLSIGVHLLNLLTIPAIVMVYYFKRYPVTKSGTIVAFLIGCAITGLVQFGVIQVVPILCLKMEVFFVNTIGLPFNSGVFFTILLLAVGGFFLLRWSKKKAHYFVHLGALCFIFIIIGYSSFFSTIIRSNADVPIDMTNPDNAATFIPYLQREQYGQVPLLYGPDFNSVPERKSNGYPEMKEGAMQYRKGEKKYDELGRKKEERVYSSDQMRFFPRVWDDNNPTHIRYYKDYLGLADKERASSGDNLKFFFGYQVNQMWWRYFCWNYIGKQNDIQNISGEPQYGNWLSGINFLDKPRVGDMSKMPDALRNNRAHNTLFFLPFLLGIIGFILHFTSDKRNTLIVGLLFFFTGFAIVLYLNNTPIQPRERDYAYAGATYAFAIWIGLGVMMISDWLKRLGLGLLAPTLSTAICLVAVPVLMASQEWNDHDRSKKKLALASAKNFLNSCEPNAILFTEGDNDTYPLWYAQEVEGYRTDVRMVNISLLGIDWYIDQLRYAVNKTAPVNLIWKPEQYRGQNRDYILYDNSMGAQDKYADLTDVLNFVGSDEDSKRIQGDDEMNNFFPTKNFYIPVDKQLVLKNHVVDESDSANIVDRVMFTMPKNVAYKNDLAILNILAANAWKRPIYFANSIETGHYEGLEEYLQLEGLAYKLVPIRTPGSTSNTPLRVNVKQCMDLVMNKFEYGNAGRKDVFFDQTNRRLLNTPRILAAQFANYLITVNREPEAIQVLDKVCNSISEESFPIILTQEERSWLMIAEIYIRAGAKEQAKRIVNKLLKFTEQDIAYKNSLPEGIRDAKLEDWRLEIGALSFLAQSCAQNNMKDIADPVMNKLSILSQGLPPPQQQQPEPQE